MDITPNRTVRRQVPDDVIRIWPWVSAFLAFGGASYEMFGHKLGLSLGQLMVCLAIPTFLVLGDLLTRQRFDWRQPIWMRIGFVLFGVVAAVSLSFCLRTVPLFIFIFMLFPEALLLLAPLFCLIAAMVQGAYLFRWAETYRWPRKRSISWMLFGLCLGMVAIAITERWYIEVL